MINTFSVTDVVDKSYKCIENLNFSLSPKINIVIGDRGSGKSALLSAMAIATHCKLTCGTEISRKSRMLRSSVGKFKLTKTAAKCYYFNCAQKVDGLSHNQSNTMIFDIIVALMCDSNDEKNKVVILIDNLDSYVDQMYSDKMWRVLTAFSNTNQIVAASHRVNTAVRGNYIELTEGYYDKCEEWCQPSPWSLSQLEVMADVAHKQDKDIREAFKAKIRFKQLCSYLGKMPSTKTSRFRDKPSIMLCVTFESKRWHITSNFFFTIWKAA